MEQYILTRKSQIWSLDIIIASVIFLSAIIFFYLYLVNQPNEQMTIDKMHYDGRLISESLLSEGNPSDWNEGNVLMIGLTSNGKINETKLERFYNFSRNDYGGTKRIFSTTYNYAFLLAENMTIGNEIVGMIGKPGANPETEAKNLIKVTRLTIYKNKPETAYIYIWN